jgi:aspartate aminotransferase
MLQGQYTSGPSSIAQKAAVAAYTGSQECVAEMGAAFERRRDLIVGLLKEIPGLNVNNPMGAFYIFPECKSLIGRSYNGKVMESATDIAMFLLEEAHVACVGGDAFGAPGCIRISYATSDENIKNAVARIKTALEKLS